MTDPQVQQAELSDDEKRAVIDNDRRVREQGSTFDTFAKSGVGNEGRESGRFSKLDVKPLIHKLPDSSPWSGVQPNPGDEPPLGYSIDDLGLQKSGAPVTTPVDATDARGGEPPCAAPTSSEDK
jgi:hypothetical protein